MGTASLGRDQAHAVFVHPYDDPDVIAGQGTIAMEILRQTRREIDAIFVAIGGGGLISGIASYVKRLRPNVKVIGVEPFDAVLDVTEPMGMETFVYFTLEGTQICGRVNPNAGARAGGPLRLAVDLNNMHLLNEGTGAVI